MGRVTGISVTESGFGYSESRLPAIVCTSGIASVAVVAPGAAYTDSGSMLVDCPPPCTGSGLAGTCIADGIASVSIASAGASHQWRRSNGRLLNVPCSSKRVALVMDLLELAQQMVLPQLLLKTLAGGTRIGSSDHALPRPKQLYGSGFLGTCVADGIAGILVRPAALLCRWCSSNC